MTRQRVSTDTEWKSKVGYSRAVRTDTHVQVTGTVGADEEGEIVGEDDPYRQTMQALQIIQNALEEVDARLDDVVRTRIYVTDIDQWERIGDAHREVFGDIRPATSMVEVSRLITPEALVEIEADAIVQSTQ